MQVKSLRLKNSSRTWTAGLYWYSRETTGHKSSDKTLALANAEATYNELHTNIVKDSADHDEVNTVDLSGILIKNGRSITVGFAKAAEIDSSSYPLLQLVMDHAEARWTLPTVVIRIALDENYHWLSFINRGKLTLSSDIIVDARESATKLNSLRAKAPEKHELIDITDVDEAQKELYQWEKKVKKKKLRKIDSFTELRKNRLRDHRAFNTVAWSAAVVILLTTANYGYDAYQAYQSRLAEIEEQQRLQALQEVGPAPRPWTETAHFAPLYQTCIEQYLSRPAYKYGWSMVRWACNEDSEIREWNRGDTGSFSILPVHGAFSVRNPNMLTETNPMPVLSERGKTPIVKKNQAARILMDVARIESIRTSFSWGSENTRRVPRGDEYITENLGHATHRVEFTADSQFSAKFVNSIARLPSLYLVNIERTLDRWKLNVEFYAEAE